jgi:A/G-specific adenine glycosylase
MQQLPGIGKYTAHAVATFGFNQSVAIIEANTARALARLFDVRQRIDSSAGRKILWQRAARLVPKSNARVYNSALVDLGALICVPREPKCGICPVKKFCRAKNPATLPIAKLRGRTKRITETHAFVVKRARVLLEQSRHRWRGMWILPATKRCKPGQVPIYTASFPFTNHRVTLKVYLRELPAIDHSHHWIRIDSLEAYPIPSPHRRALLRLLSLSAAAQPHRQPSSER